MYCISDISGLHQGDRLRTIGYLRNPGSLIALSEVSHCGIRPFCVFLEALLHYASPNWLADVTLCLGVASPPSV